MTSFPNHYIAIDTNVFGHILNNEINEGNHISHLLRTLREKGTALVVDNEGKISDEYSRHLLNEKISSRSDKQGEHLIVLYWITRAPRKTVVIRNDSLFVAIKEIIPKRECVDRIFVYISFKKGCVLISNDKKDIINSRDKLYKACNPETSEILTSKEAAERIG